MRSLIYILFALMLTACGGSQYPDATHGLTFLNCANTFQNGVLGGIAGSYKDPSNGTLYILGQDCTFQTYTLDSCQMRGSISPNRTGGTSMVTVDQVKPMAGCLPAGRYACNLTPSAGNLLVDCGANGVLNLVQP